MRPPRLCSTALLLCATGCFSSPSDPNAGERLQAWSTVASQDLSLDEGAAVPEAATLSFDVRGPAGGWLYLLETQGETRVIAPAPQHVIPATETPQRLVPHSFATDAGTGWRSAHRGEVRYTLVWSAFPKDVSGSKGLADVETFLRPPPSLSGPAAAPARVLDEIRLRW